IIRFLVNVLNTLINLNVYHSDPLQNMFGESDNWIIRPSVNVTPGHQSGLAIKGVSNVYPTLAWLSKPGLVNITSFV
ncbi:Hypothetical predicted protein, partial [Mytilus galloprovincialis]